MDNLILPNADPVFPRRSLWRRPKGFYVSRRHCCNKPCAYCTGKTPKRFQVVLAGITAGTLADCSAALNATFSLTQKAADACQYLYTFTPACSCGTWDVLLFWFPQGGGAKLELQVGSNTGSLLIFRQTFDPTIACNGPDGLDLPFVAGESNNRCADGTSATATVTAL